MRAIDRRRHQANAAVTPLMPQQIRDSIARGKADQRRFIRQFLLGSVGVQAFFVTMFLLWDPVAYLPLIAVATLTLPLFLVALIWLRRGFAFGAGVIAVTVPIAPIVAYTSAFSVDSSIHIMLFVFGLGIFVLIPDEKAHARLYMGVGIYAVFVVCETVFTESRAWAELDAETVGTFAAVIRATTGASIVLLAIVLHRRMEFDRHILEGAARHGELLATTDDLTGLPNRRPVIAQLEQFEKESMTDYAIVLIDIDHFKSVNDEFGHSCGDVMIRHVGHHLREHFRETDMASRWGGDEFLVLMPHIPRRSLVSVLERLRSSIAAMTVPCVDHMHHVTVSVGAAHGVTGETADECIAAADHALYRAKHEGRDRVVAVGTSER